MARDPGINKSPTHEWPYVNFQVCWTSGAVPRGLIESAGLVESFQAISLIGYGSPAHFVDSFSTWQQHRAARDLHPRSFPRPPLSAPPPKSSFHRPESPRNLVHGSFPMHEALTGSPVSLVSHAAEASCPKAHSRIRQSLVVVLIKQSLSSSSTSAHPPAARV
jgi:hypothetical protein